MRKFVVFILLYVAISAWALPPTLWYRPDSLVSFPQEDSISWTDSYIVLSVLRTLHADSTDCLWSFSENDTTSLAILSNGIYLPAGMIRSRNPRDFSKWCIYAYHSGIKMDSTKRHTLRLGEQVVCHRDSSGIIYDTLHARIETEEFVYFGERVPKLQTDMFQTYLALKYGITLDYAPYLSCYGDTLWHPVIDEYYYHRIIGIGNDSIHGWFSLCSTSKEHAALHIQADSLNYGEYVIVGDNGGELEWRQETMEEYALQRRWRLRTHLGRSPVVHAMLTLPSSVANIRLVAQSEIDGQTRIFMPDSILFDTVYHFTLNQLDTITQLYVCATPPDSVQNRQSQYYDSYDNGDGIVYDSRTNSIMVTGFSDDQMFDLYLYSGVGQFITTISSRNPISVSTLPQVVSYIEIFASGQIVGSITLPIHM